MPTSKLDARFSEVMDADACHDMGVRHGQGLRMVQQTLADISLAAAWPKRWATAGQKECIATILSAV
jgi:hypothetical protein